MKKTLINAVVFTMLVVCNCFSQFKINNNSVGIPKATTTQISQILNPETGMVVYDSSTNCLKMFNGTKWVSVMTNDIVNIPTASINSGSFTECQIVTLATNSITNKIYYTIDGTTPTITSNLYSTPVKISSSSTLKAMAVNDCKINSDIMTKSYAITPLNGQIGGIHYAYWNFGTPLFTTFEINFKVYDYPRNSDGSISNDGLYFQMNQATINGHGFYYGIQNTVTNPATQVSGRGFIFSRFGTTDLSNIQIAPNGFTEAGTYEGPFISVRRYYDWKPQSYKFKLIKTSTDAVGDWYSIYLKDLVTLQEEFMGAIRFPLVPLNQQGISNNGISWTEIYSKVNANTPLPNWHISVSNPVVNSNTNFVNVLTSYSQTMQNTDIFYNSTDKEMHFYMGANVCREHSAGTFNR
jgi:hypothetical protein